MRFLIIFIFTIIFINIFIHAKSYSSKISENFFFSSKGDLTLDQIKKIINTNMGFIFKNNQYNYSADNITIWYNNLNNLDLEHINRIESSNNVKILTNNKSSISADRYVYSLSAGVHTLISEKKPVIYKDNLRTLKAKDRIEYFTQKNVVVVRGNPILTGKNNIKSAEKFTFLAKLINIKLTDYKDKNNNYSKNMSKDIVFVEAIEKVTFIEGDTTIKSDYAIYYKKENQIEFYDNVTFINKESKLVGDAALYNFKSGYGSLISKSANKSLIGTYNLVKKKNEQK